MNLKFQANYLCFVIFCLNSCIFALSKFKFLFHKKQSTPQKFKQSPKFATLTLNKEKYLKLCHTERSEVSINLKRGYFANAQYDSSGMDFRFLSKAQNDKTYHHEN